MPRGPRLAFRTAGLGKGTPPQVPAEAEAREVVDSTLVERAAAAAALDSAVHDVRRVQSESEAPEVCTVSACCLLRTRFVTVLHMVLCGLVQVPAAASSNATDLPAHATRPDRQQPSNAWLDTTVPVDSNQFDEPSTAASIQAKRARSRGALRISVAAVELND